MIKYAIFLFSLLICSGCTPEIYSPPARFHLLETPETMNRGDHSLGGTFGLAGSVFTTHAMSATLAYRTGLAEFVDVGVDANVAKVGARDCTRSKNGSTENCGSSVSPPIDDLVYSGRVQTKWVLVERNVSLVVGFGGGHNTAAGSYVSPDVGMILADRIGGFTAFLGGAIFVSQPFNTRPVDVSNLEPPWVDDQPPGTLFEEAFATWGWYANTGFSYRIPTPNPDPLIRIELQAGLNIYQLSHLEDTLDGADSKRYIAGLGLQMGPKLTF